MNNLRNSIRFSVITLALFSANTMADQVILDDLIVDGSICAGFDCVNGESFGFDTLRLKENNLRIRAVDTSSSASFPSRDWQITFNDTSNGGANKFAIDDIDGGRTPFTIEAGAPSHSLYVEDGGRLGLGTSTPVVDIHVKKGNTPTLRLEQDGTSGFSAQTWDVAGNEANFFVRDASNGSTLPFRIFPGAPSNALSIEATGDVGIGTNSPITTLHVKDATGAITVESTDGETTKDLLTLKNNGKSQIVFQDTSVTPTTEFWKLSNEGGDFYIVNPTHNGSEMMLSQTGALTLQSTDGLTTKDMLTLKNNGKSQIVFEDTSGSPSTQFWKLSNDGGDFYIVNPTAAGTELALSQTGDLSVSGTVNGTSSFKTKENIKLVDTSKILNLVASLAIPQWNYKKDSSDVVHIGPISEEFHKAFGLNGTQDDRISYTDINGVALASIQALKAESDEKDLKISSLENKINELSDLVKNLAEK